MNNDLNQSSMSKSTHFLNHRKRCHAIRKYEKKFRMFIRYLTKSKVFYWLVLVLVFLNTVAMSLTQYEQKPEVKEILGRHFHFLCSLMIISLLRMLGNDII